MAPQEHLIAGALGAFLLAALVSPAGAQTGRRPAAATPSSAAAAPAVLSHGPALPGVCIFYEQRAVASSTAGQAAGTRLQQLAAQAKAEIDPQQAAFQTDLAAFQKSRATLAPDAAQKQETALSTRYTALERLANQRQQELQRTQTRALDRIRNELDPLVRAVYQGQHCSMLLNGDGAVFAANPAMDVTAQVVAQLNTKLPTITFDREHLDQPGAAQR